MILNKETRQDVYFELGLSFMDALEHTDKVYEQISMVDTTKKGSKKYKWMESLPKMQKWISERPIHKLKGAGHVISNEDYAVGIEVERDDLEDDEDLGQVKNRINDLALLGIETINDEVISHYVNGFDATHGTCYDGQFLFDTDHTIAADGTGASMSNKGTAAFSKAAFEAAFTGMMSWKDQTGRSIKVRPTVLLHGPSIWADVRDVILIPELAGGGTNPNYQLVIPVMSQEITGNEWFLLDTRKSARAVITQIRRQPEFRAPVTSIDDFEAYSNKNYHFGADVTFGCGYGPWFLAWGSDATS